MTPEQRELAKHRFERAEVTLAEAIDELSRFFVGSLISIKSYAFMA